MPPSLVSGQIAINEADGKLFYRNGSGVVTELATGGGGGGTELYSYSTTASFPSTGSATALYLSIDSGRVYQWNGSVYSEVGPIGGGGALSATVTIPEAGDPYWSSVPLLLRGDSIVDSSAAARTVTAYGAASASGTARYGTGSLLMSSVGDYFSVPASNDFSFSTGDFTAEAWIYPTAYAENNNGQYQSVIFGRQVYPDQCWAMGIDGTASSFTGLTFLAFDDSSYALTVGAHAFSLNQWTHVAASRVNGVLYLFANGVLLNAGGTSFAVNNRTSSLPLLIGALNYDYTYRYQFFGRIDDARITKGVGRYAATFTPPTATYATGNYTAAQTLSVVGTGSVGPSEDAALRALFLPAAPTGLTVTGGNAQAVLSWTAPSVSAQTPITDYREQFSSDNGATWSTFSAAASTATSATITGLSNGTAYVFRVAAVNALGTGAYTAASSAVTPAAAAGVTVLSGSASGSGTNTITATATGNISVSVPSTRTLTWTGSPGQYIVGPQQAGFSYDSEIPGWYRNFLGSSFSVIAGTYTTENTGNGATFTFTP